MATKTVSVSTADGGRMDAYLALPESGAGPGLILLHEVFGVTPYLHELAELYAAEGYAAIVPDLFWRLERNAPLGSSEAELQRAIERSNRFDLETGIGDIGDTIATLRAMPGCNGKVAAVGFCFGGMLAYMTAARCPVDAIVSYYGVGIEKHLDEADAVRCPALFHFAGQDHYVPPAACDAIVNAFKGRDEIQFRTYPEAGHGFNNPTRPTYDRFCSLLAHSHTIGLLRQAIGPRYDLSALWDRHADFEFKYHDAEATMKTMVAEPYVNHIPVMTGGVGQRELHRFYKHHFIPSLPKDTKMIPVSRTVGPDRVVDELIFCFTHDREIDFMFPGIPPTGKYVEVPTVAIIQFRGDKLVHEHIHWDQASALVQMGLLDPAKLPVVGREGAEKARDETRPSNALMRHWRDSEGRD